MLHPLPPQLGEHFVNFHVSSIAHWACKCWSRAADLKLMLLATEADLLDLAAFNAVPGLSDE